MLIQPTNNANLSYCVMRRFSSAKTEAPGLLIHRALALSKSPNLSTYGTKIQKARTPQPQNTRTEKPQESTCQSKDENKHRRFRACISITTPQYLTANALPPSATDCLRLHTAFVGKPPSMIPCTAHLKTATETLIQGHCRTRCGPACRNQH